MMFSTLTSHAEAWFHELGLGADHEYHKAVTAFLGWVSDEAAKDKAAVDRLVAKGYTVAGPVPTLTTPVPVSAE